MADFIDFMQDALLDVNLQTESRKLLKDKKISDSDVSKSFASLGKGYKVSAPDIKRIREILEEHERIGGEPEPVPSPRPLPMY